jgi:hypothetical protein
MPAANAISRRAFAATLGVLAFGRPLRASAVMVGCGMGLPVCTWSGGGWPGNICGNCDEVDPWDCECQRWGGSWVFCCECENCQTGPENCQWNSDETQYPTHDCSDPSCESFEPCECDKPDEDCPDPF